MLFGKADVFDAYNCESASICHLNVGEPFYLCEPNTVAAYDTLSERYEATDLVSLQFKPCDPTLTECSDPEVISDFFLNNKLRIRY